MMSRNLLATLLMATLAPLGTSQLQGQTPIVNPLYWEGGNGFLTDANYTNLTLSDLPPSPSDSVFFGGGGATGVTGTLSGVGEVFFNRLFVGHSEDAVTGPPDLRGNGTLNVSGGAKVNLTGGAAGAANAGLIVGDIRTGVLNIDGAGSSVTSNRLIVIGFANGQPSRSGTVNVTNGGALVAADGNIDLGTNPGGAAQSGMQGHLVVSGEGSLVQTLGPGTDLNVGIRKATSSVTQSGGVIDVIDIIEVGFGGTGTVANENSSFNISAGSTTNGGNFFLGRGASTGATVNISGTGELNVGNRYIMGWHTATGAVTNHSGGAINVGVDFRIGDGENYTGDSTYNLSGTGVLTSNGGGIVGRQGTGKFFQTGGQADLLGALSIGKRETVLGATDGLYKISAGILNAGAMIGTTALDVAPNGTGQFRVVGDDATINLFGNAIFSSTVDGTGTLAFELEAGDLLSTINVTDAATFGAGSKLVLDVTQALPSQTSYDLLTAASITIDPGLLFDGPTGWNYEIVDGGAVQTLRVFGPLIESGDFDADGDVGGEDFLAWQSGFGGAPPRPNGNANGDVVINAQDFAIWKQQFGTVDAPAAGVPEPGSFGLLLMGLATFAARARRATHGA